MEETISQRFQRLSGALAEKTKEVPADKWSAQSPCEDWKAIDVVRHVSQTPGMFFQMIGQEPPPVPPVEDDPVAAVEAMRANLQQALDDPAVATTEFDGLGGRTTFESAVDRFLNFDLVVHNWDLSRAAGLDDSIPDADLARVEELSSQFGDAMRAPGVFGPALTPPADVDRQTKLLAFLGRQAY